MKRITGLFVFLLLLGNSFLIAQETITGVVTSAEDGEPIPGVSVVVDGTTIGTITDIEGEYSITVPSDTAILRYSFVGMEEQLIPLEGRSSIDIALETATIGVEEVVVTALGIPRSAKALGYASATVSGDEITKTKTNDPMSALSGKIAGVDISVGSSSPGASNTVIVRGMSSLSGNNQPLYVVDGVAIINESYVNREEDGTIDGLNGYYDFGAGNQMLNPNDIESVNVLKSAAASALYGNRAANGVVLITTKSGRKNQDMKVTINSAYQTSDILRLPEWQNDFGMGWDGHHTMIENGSWGPEFDGTLRRWGNVYNNSQKVKPFVAQEDNMADFFDYGQKFSNSVSVQGGTDKSTYYASFSNITEDGIIPSDIDSYGKTTGAFRASHDFGRLEISSSLNITRQNNSFAPTGQGLSVINSISQIPRDISIVGLSDYEDDPFDNLDYFFTPYGIINPYYVIDHSKAESEAQKVFGKLEFNLELTSDLYALYRLGYDATDNEQESAFPRIVFTPGSPNEGQITEPGFVDRTARRRSEISHYFSLNYSKTFNDFGVIAVAGLDAIDNKRSLQRTKVSNLDIPDFFDLSNSSERPFIEEDQEQKRLVGVLGNVELSYRELVFLTLSGRQDYSSTLPEDNNSYFYPGAQLSFIFSDLLSDDIQDIVSFGQVRMSWGKTGLDADPYQIANYFEQTTAFNPFMDLLFPLQRFDPGANEFVGQNAFEVDDYLADLELQPEIRTETEVGLRMDFFQGRLGFDVSLYQSISNNQIYPLGLDFATGYRFLTTNIGEIENKGIEVLFNVIPIQTSSFDWRVNFNFTKNEETLKSLPEQLGNKISLGGTSTLAFVSVVGEPLGVFEVTVPERTADGRLIVNEDGQPVSAAEKEIVPKASFDYTMGISNSFSYKGVNLSVDFDIREGGLLYSRTKDLNLFTGNLIETTYNNRKPFVIPNSVQAVDDADGAMDDDGSAEEDYVENTVPIADDGLVSYWTEGGSQLNRAYLLPRSYVKLRRVSLGYTLPRKWFSQLPLSDITLSVYGNNLLLWTPAENHHIDPESSTFGNDIQSRYGEFSVNPPTRNYGVNVQLVF